MNIQEIKVEKFPVVIFSDSHTNIENIKKLKELYPAELIISLGDLTFLWSKPGQTNNHKSIDFFINNNIPALRGNHEEHILGCSTGDSFAKILPKYQDDHSIIDRDIYDLTQQQINYLRKLPIGFKLLLRDGRNYYCFHNSPRDLWGFREEAYKEYAFLKEYPIDDRTVAVIRGHEHRNIIVDFPNVKSKLITIGQLCNRNHHTGENSGCNYALLTGNNIEFKKL